MIDGKLRHQAALDDRRSAPSFEPDVADLRSPGIRGIVNWDPQATAMFVTLISCVPLISYSVTVIASYYTAAFFQAFCHRYPGQQRRGRAGAMVHAESPA